MRRTHVLRGGLRCGCRLLRVSTARPTPVACQVASILLTGVYGASLGPPLLSALGLPPTASGHFGVAPLPPPPPPATRGGGGSGDGDERGEAEGAIDAAGDAAGDVVGAGAAVARGVAMGASAHAIGTAALVGRGEAKAGAVASVALCVAGVAHASLLALPPVRRLVHALVAPPFRVRGRSP